MYSERTTPEPTSADSSAERQTRVDVYEADKEGRPGRWLACGSLVAPQVVTPHVPLPQVSDLEVVCVLAQEWGETIRGRTLASADGAKATAVGLETPSGLPIADTPRIPDLDHGDPLDRWIIRIAHLSGCSHLEPKAPAKPDVEVASWLCRLWPTAPGCR